MNTPVANEATMAFKFHNFHYDYSIFHNTSKIDCMNDYITVKFKIFYSLYLLVYIMYLYLLFINIRNDLYLNIYIYIFTHLHIKIIFDVFIFYVFYRLF